MKIGFEILIETKCSSRDSLTSLKLVFNLGFTLYLQSPFIQILNTLKRHKMHSERLLQGQRFSQIMA